MERCGVEVDGLVNAKQFAHYVHEQDRHLYPIYAQMDRNMQGKVDLMDVQAYFMKIGIPIEPNEAKHLLRRIDRNNNDCIEYEEWRKFLLFLPIGDLASVTQFWRHGAVRLILLSFLKYPLRFSIYLSILWLLFHNL